MHAEEFIAELDESPALSIPREVAARLPKNGKVRVIVLAADDDEDAGWRAAAYEQFLREDPPEDAIYDALR